MVSLTDAGHHTGTGRIIRRTRLRMAANEPRVIKNPAFWNQGVRARLNPFAPIRINLVGKFRNDRGQTDRARQIGADRLGQGQAA